MFYFSHIIILILLLRRKMDPEQVPLAPITGREWV